jgi:hypothetical protein
MINLRELKVGIMAPAIPESVLLGIGKESEI